jgi:hypothetical protein
MTQPPMAEEPAEQHELDVLHDTRATTMPPEEVADVAAHDEQLHRRTLRKLDFLLLPFLALLFLFNSLDKSNVRVHPRMASNCSSAHAAHR